MKQFTADYREIDSGLSFPLIQMLVSGIKRHDQMLRFILGRLTIARIL
jgi:hypothetical protein